MKVRNLAIVIFPYFFVYEKDGLEIEGIKIKPSYTENIEKEEETIREQLLRIATFFRFGRDNQVFQWCYFTTYLNNANQWKGIEEKLNKFANILRYIELSDLKENAKFGQLNYFLFELTSRQIAKDQQWYSYPSILNGHSAHNFQIKDNKVEKPFTPVEELHPLIVNSEKITSNEYFSALYQFSSKLFKGGEDQKILRAIEWFNRSYSHHGRGVDLSEGILNIHTALEALLRPADEDRGVKSQLKTALNSLLGHSKELDSWFDSFWKLRNSIVHGDVTPTSFMYIHPQSKIKKGHRHHLYLARKVFVECLNSIIKVRSGFPLMGFEEEFVSNEVRVLQAKKLLKQKNISTQKLYDLGVFENISGLRTDDISTSKKEAKILGELFLPFLKQDLEQNEEEPSRKEIIDKIEDIFNWKGKDLGDLAIIYGDLENLFSKIYFKSTYTEKIESLALRSAAYNLLGFMTWRLLTFFNE